MTLVVDVMFVNNVEFLINMSQGIIFVTIEHVMNYTDKQLSKYLKIVIYIYSHGKPNCPNYFNYYGV